MSSAVQARVSGGVVAVLIGALLGSGCPRAQPEQEAPAPAVLVSRGMVAATLNRYVDSTLDEPFEQFGVTGTFAQYDLEREDLVDRLLGARAPDPDLALDSCSTPAPVLSSRERRPLGGETAITLIDVGDLSVKVGGERHPVPTRTFPDLLKVIDGVIYSADQSQGVRYEPGETYAFHASGTDEVSPFEVVLEAPDDLGEIKVDGVQPSEQVPVIRRAGDLELVWEGAGYGDEVIATLSWNRMSLPWSFTCRMRDDGLFVVPEQITRSLYAPLGGSDVEMSLTRVRQVAFRSRGLSSGAFSFVVSTNFLVEFEADH